MIANLAIYIRNNSCLLIQFTEVADAERLFIRVEDAMRLNESIITFPTPSGAGSICVRVPDILSVSWMDFDKDFAHNVKLRQETREYNERVDESEEKPIGVGPTSR
jgi:hypothetical protein